MPPMPQDKIKHVVVLMMENRSFDHLFGFRPGVNGLKGDEFNLLLPSQPQSLSNPPFTVGAGAAYAISAGEGPGHSVNQTNVQLFGSKDTSGSRPIPASSPPTSPSSASTRCAIPATPTSRRSCAPIPPPSCR